MKVVFQKDDISGKVSDAMGCVSNKNTITSVEGILLTAIDNDKCEICSYDLEKGFKSVIPAKVTEGGSFSINAAKLNQIIKIMSGSEITIEITDKGLAKISCGRTEFEIFALAGSEFPGLPELESENSFKIQQSYLRKMISQISFAIAANDSRPALNGALFKISGKTLTLVSCDGNRLAIRNQNCSFDDENVSLDNEFIIPGKTLSELMKLIKDTEDMITVNIGRKHVVFAINDDYFFSRLIDAEYIDYDRFLPKSNRTFVKLDRDMFINCIESAQLVTDSGSLGQAKSAAKCDFNVNDGLLRVTSNTVNGKSYAEMPIDIEGSDILIGFNCRFLLEPLRACGTEKLKVSLSSPLMGILIESDEKQEDESFLYLVLPTRIV